MAQAAFFVNDLKIIDKGKILVLEAQRQCSKGEVVDQIFLTFPEELKRVFADFAGPSVEGSGASEVSNTAWRNRMRKFFDSDS